MSALTSPPVTHVTVEPARIPTPDSDPRGKPGAGVDVTNTVAVSASAPLVALTVLGSGPGTAPPVKRPVPALMVPPPFTTDQTGEAATMLPAASLTTAVNCCVAFV